MQTTYLILFREGINTIHTKLVANHTLIDAVAFADIYATAKGFTVVQITLFN